MTHSPRLPTPCTDERIRRSLPSASMMSTPVLSTPTTLALSSTSTPMFSSCFLAAVRELVAKRTQHGWCRVQQNDLRFRGVDATEVPAQRAVCQLADLACHLDPGRTGTDHNEGQPLLPLFGVVAELCKLERAEDPTAQLQRIIDALHPRGELGELIIAEVRLTSARRDDQGCRTG